ncbi:AAA family ATPase [Sodalis sp. dw_96]|uniref:AAA family ATPase n=1 Tax=Sodalis sp. dw_96 TaxID=2719794 RepID=UPI001BD68EFB|nr:AAA family ATPase [Sodalis sp. dw_96]
MEINTNQLIIVTGGPDSGKTTLINKLHKMGYACTVESGRGVIQAQVAIEGQALPWKNPLLFAEFMLSWEKHSWYLAAQMGTPVFFDRGIPDVVGYLNLLEIPVPAHIINAVMRFRYSAKVFIAPPWPEIFVQDAERKQTFNEAVLTYDSMCQAYTKYSYDLVEIPRVPVADRAEFILSEISKEY